MNYPAGITPPTAPSISTLPAIRKAARRAAAAKPTTSTPKASPLVRRLTPIVSSYDWQCDVCRMPCDDARSRTSTALTVAAPNAVVLWRTGRVAFLGWLWEVQDWTDAQLVARLDELEREAV